MAKITITIDGDNITINKSNIPTKVEQKTYFIIICKYANQTWVKFVSDNYIEAANKLKILKINCDNNNYKYELLIQNELGRIQPCKGLNYNINN